MPALPASVPSGGGDVGFTVTVQNTGSGGGGSADLQQVDVATDNGGCTLSAPSGTGAPDTLAVGDTWTYTCTVTDVAPDTTVNAWVYACNSNGGACNVDSHDATDNDGVTVTLGEEVHASDAAPVPAEHGNGRASPDGGSVNAAWMLAIVIGVLGASALILKTGTGSPPLTSFATHLKGPGNRALLIPGVASRGAACRLA